MFVTSPEGTLGPDHRAPPVLKRAYLAAALLVLAAPGLAAPALAVVSEDDPLEPVNRAVFEFNRVVDGLVIEPAARVYRMVFPRIVRDGIRNAVANLATPVVLANDLLQGEFERAELTLGRFMLNTTLGLGGIIDIGAHVGMPERHYEDFGQTLAVWGVGSGPYLVLPILGPSNPRDALGYGVDFLFDPFALLAPTEATLGRGAASGVSLREENLETLAELERTSLDYYASVRTLYRQMRAAAIRQGAPAPLEDIYDERIFEDDLEDPAALENEGDDGP